MTLKVFDSFTSKIIKELIRASELKQCVQGNHVFKFCYSFEKSRNSFKHLGWMALKYLQKYNDKSFGHFFSDLFYHKTFPCYKYVRANTSKAIFLREYFLVAF